MKLFRRNNINKLKARERELLQEMRNFKLSTNELVQPYELPLTFRKLEELQIKNQIATQSIGFELWLDRPITPSPKDLIPFAITGGDSCYFAFVTDYGNQPNLEDCPIAFISPTDFDANKPKQSNFLIAKNIREFLSLMISLGYAEHLRFQNIYEPSINKTLANSISEFESEQNKDEIELRNKTVKKLFAEFRTYKILNFHKHFESVKESRSQDDNLQTLDGLNIFYESTDELKEINGQIISEYLLNLKEENKKSILVAVRDAPYKFTYSNSEYGEYKASLISIFKDLNLGREQRIQEFEIKMDKLSNEWMKIRKQIIKDER